MSKSQRSKRTKSFYLTEETIAKIAQLAEKYQLPESYIVRMSVDMYHKLAGATPMPALPEN